MTIGAVPKPLDDAFRDLLIDVARAHGLPTLADPSRLAPHVAALTAAYNDASLRGLAGVDHRAGRLGFFFARDVPKIAGAVREAIAIGRVRARVGASLKVLDLGAGLGASHRGLARALDHAGISGELDVLAIDADARALELAKDLARRRPREGSVTIRLRTESRDAHAPLRDRFDVVLLGNVLTELDLDRPADDRVEAHRALLASLVRERLAPEGVLVVVEPALRPRSRHLQRVRGALLEAKDAHVLAPCLHEGRCPLLGRESDWCHDDLDVDLPKWLVPVARAAGLRWEGLTFSYLVLVAAPPTLRLALAPLVEGKAERAVSAAMPTKGKVEVVLCGDPLRDDVAADDALGPFGVRAGRLDREKSAENQAILSLRRGDVIDVRAPLDDKHRARAATTIARLDDV